MNPSEIAGLSGGVAVIVSAGITAIVARRGQKQGDLQFFVGRFENEIKRLDDELGKARTQRDAAEIEIRGLTNQVADLQRSQLTHEEEKADINRSHLKIIMEKEARIAELENLTADLSVRLDKLEQQRLAATKKHL